MNSSNVGGFSSQPKIFPRHHAHVVAGSPHQRRFDLVVAEDMPLLLAVSGQHRQLAMLDERFEPQDGVVPPIRPAIALPPRAADRVGAHAKPHAELKDAGEQLVDGNPTTRPCRMPSLGSACMIRTRRMNGVWRA